MEQNKDFSLLFIRLALAIVFIAHGWVKLTGLSAASESFFELGAPFAGFLAMLAAVIEFFGGIALLLGIYSRVAAGLIACVMATAILEVRFFAGLIGGFEYELTLLLCALAIVFGGPGKATIINLIKKRKII